MIQSNSDRKRLAKNTLLLYGRTIIVMFVSLYVSRLILNILGVSDYGVYNAVGGVVGMFALISGSLVAATQRYISFELGKEDGKPSYVFSLAMGLHMLIALIILLIAEILGVWFLNSYMNLPEERITAANWVFQFSVLSFVLHLITIPYSAIIIAQERMGVYAVICILETLLKLGFALILLVAFKDKLIYYSISMALVTLSGFIFNFAYCRTKYINCSRFTLEKKRVAYKQMGGFVGWNFLGSTATVLSKQGVNVLLNIFCGVILNAGRGVASQVDNAVNQFIGSFTTAIRPQITKTYAAQEYKECFNLINQGTKLIMFLTLLFVIPLTLRTDYVLTIWLKTVPDYSVLFTRLSFLIITMDALSTPLYYLMLATGKIKNYQIVAGSLALLVFPFTWVALRLGLPPEVTYYLLFLSDIFRWIFQLHFLRKIANFMIKDYINGSILPVMVVMLISSFVSILINMVIPETFEGLILLVLSTSTILIISIYLIGLSRRERKVVIDTMISRIKCYRNK